jgi:hypothetical protein
MGVKTFKLKNYNGPVDEQEIASSITKQGIKV